MITKLSMQIRGLRHKLRLTQEDFAQILGVRRVTVARWETGTRIPTAANMELLQQLFSKIEEVPQERIPEKKVLRNALKWGGMAYGLYKLLQVIYGDRDE